MKTTSAAGSASSSAGIQARLSDSLRPSGSAGFSATSTPPHWASTVAWPHCGATVHVSYPIFPHLRGGGSTFSAASVSGLSFLLYLSAALLRPRIFFFFFFLFF